MKKIINYIVNGQGLGVKYLAVLALVLGLVFGVFIKVYGQDGVPYAQQISDQLLPIEVVDGQIVNPEDTYKVVHLQFGEEANPYPIPLVLDTTSDDLDLNSLDPGAYITRSNIYVVKDHEVRSYKLNGSFNLPREDYREFFTSVLNWTALGAAVFAFAGLFILYFILSLFYSVCAIPVAAIASRKTDFDQRMRLSSLALIVSYLISWGLRLAAGISLNMWLFFVIVIAFQAYLLHKMPLILVKPQAPDAFTHLEADERPVEVKTEGIKETTATVEKPKTKKAPAKKKSAAKPTKPKSPDKEKPAVKKEKK